jgi:hypothetical protein
MDTDNAKILEHNHCIGEHSMSTPKSKMDREAIRRALMDRAGNTPDENKVGEAILNIWQQMVTWLAPVIGVRGVYVLFSRSLHLTNSTFPGLAVNGDHVDNDTLLLSLKERLSDCEKDDAIEASYVLLVTFTELLSTLIGESLTEQLLRPVWAPPPPTIDQETES